MCAVFAVTVVIAITTRLTTCAEHTPSISHQLRGMHYDHNVDDCLLNSVAGPGVENQQGDSIVRPTHSGYLPVLLPHKHGAGTFQGGDGHRKDLQQPNRWESYSETHENGWPMLFFAYFEQARACIKVSTLRPKHECCRAMAKLACDNLVKLGLRLHPYVLHRNKVVSPPWAMVIRRLHLGMNNLLSFVQKVVWELYGYCRSLPPPLLGRVKRYGTFCSAHFDLHN
jgi:hypothetical protein